MGISIMKQTYFSLFLFCFKIWLCISIPRNAIIGFLIMRFFFLVFCVWPQMLLKNSMFFTYISDRCIYFVYKSLCLWSISKHKRYHNTSKQLLDMGSYILMLCCTIKFFAAVFQKNSSLDFFISKLNKINAI